MRDLQIDWLKCFVATIDAGSLSSAAAEIHRSQSAVSMQLKKLEAAVGHRLLRRDARQLELTHEGQTLLGYARRMLDLQALPRRRCARTMSQVSCAWAYRMTTPADT